MAKPSELNCDRREREDERDREALLEDVRIKQVGEIVEAGERNEVAPVKRIVVEGDPQRVDRRIDREG
jgi:hypothetical protein